MVKKTKTKNPEYAIAADDWNRLKKLEILAKRRLGILTTKLAKNEREMVRLENHHKALTQSLNLCQPQFKDAIDAVESAKEKIKSTPQYLENDG